MRRGYTRSHSELGSQALQRRWYFALRYGRVGRCQALKILMNKNHIIVTGGAGFIGSNLIQHLLTLKKFKIISIDNYSSGSLNNHIKHKDFKYLRC